MTNDQAPLRKATDIILSLEEKVDKLIKIISVYDINTKIILSRANDTLNKVNLICEYINKIESEVAQENSQAQLVSQQIPISNQSIPNEIVQISSENHVVEEKDPVGHRRTARHETYVPENVPKVSNNFSANNQEDKKSDKKLPVVQRITDQSGKDIFMAEITVLSENGEIAAKTKTNAAGKWQAHLKPGNYVVNLVKTDTVSKKKIEISQQVIVPNSNTAVTLPTAAIKR